MEFYAHSFTVLVLFWLYTQGTGGLAVTSLLCTQPYDRHHLLLLSSSAPS